MQDDNISGWVKLYHPSSAQITIPLALDSEISSDQAQVLMRSVTNLINSGFTVFAPGLEDGEQLDEIGFIVRKEKENEADEPPTPVLDLYPAKGNYRLLHVYLNNADDIALFEKVTGLKLGKMPIYEGDNAIERGKATKTDKYVVALKKPVKIVWKFNPRYDPEEKDVTKKKPRRLFVRWADAPLAPSSAPPPASKSSTTAKEPMAFEQAVNTLTPAGAAIGTLNFEQLAKLAASRAGNVTEEMRAAASIILKSTEKERVQ